MQPPTKRLGELLVEANLISSAQLQEALTYQRMAGGRMGSNLVQLGFISEDVLMDFLAQKTGVPRLNPQDLQHVREDVLRRIPQRLAEQLTVFPVAYKEPKSLVLAMADPSDLNAIDSARFASGLSIEPVVAAHSVLKKAIAESYRSAAPARKSAAIEVGSSAPMDEGLPVTFDFAPQELMRTSTPAFPAKPGLPDFGKDPFFEGGAPAMTDPMGLFSNSETPVPGEAAPVTSAFETLPTLVPQARPSANTSVRLETYHTRTLVLGLLGLLNRRGILMEDELSRYILNALERGELKDE